MTPMESRTSVIEGSLREVALADVLQLLDLGRKTGLLRVDDARGRRTARVVIVAGRVCGASLGDDETSEDALVRRALRADGRAMFETVAEALAWTSGRFAVDPLPDDVARAAATPGVGVDALLMDAARRADDWAALADRIPGPQAIPLLDTSNDSGTALALSPEEWEVLAYADGVADLRTIAARTGRDVLVVASAVHRLVGHRLLAVEIGDVAVPQEARWSSAD